MTFFSKTTKYFYPMPTIAPPLLRPHDRVAIVCPARQATHAELAAAVATLESWGLRVTLGTSTNVAHHQFGGADEVRRHDLQHQLDDPDIRAIFCARGGYGTTRIIDGLDFARFAESPKWVAGFSDITTLNCHLLGRGFQSIHGVMPLLFRPGRRPGIVGKPAAGVVWRGADL